MCSSNSHDDLVKGISLQLLTTEVFIQKNTQVKSITSFDNHQTEAPKKTKNKITSMTCGKSHKPRTFGNGASASSKTGEGALAQPLPYFQLELAAYFIIVTPQQ